VYRSDNAPWSRLHDGGPPVPPIVAAPARHCYPSSRQELIEAIRDAEGVQSPEAHGVGSGWALSEAAVTQQFLIETHGINKQLYEVIPPCLTPAAEADVVASAALRANDNPESGAYYLVHVESGMRIFELYSLIDGGDTDPRSLAAAHAELQQVAWGLPTLGGAGGQTIVGAVSTGTHGGDIHLGPVGAAVQALHLIGPGGTEHWIERHGQAFALTDDAALERVYPGIAIIRDDATFDAALVSVGRLGVVYSVVLRVVPQYVLHELRVEEPWSSIRTWIGDLTSPRFGASNRHLQIAVNPHSLPGSSDHTAFVSTRDVPASEASDLRATEAVPGRAERGGANAGMTAPIPPSAVWSQWCDRESPHAILDPLIGPLRDAAGTMRDIGIALLFVFPPWGAVCIEAARVLDEFADWLADFEASFDGTVGDLVAQIVDRAIVLGAPEAIALLNEAVVRLGQTPRDLELISYAMLDGFDYTDRECRTSAVSIEVGFPASSPAVTTFMDRLFQHLADLGHGRFVPPGSASPIRGTFVGYASLRVTDMSAASIGMQQFAPTCHIEVAGLGRIDGSIDLLAQLQADAVDLGGTVHWGQFNTLSPAQVEAMFPRLDEWRGVLGALTDNGRLATFSTPFTRARGLEIAQPQITSFAIRPTNVCAGGDLATVVWDASHNPPSTAVSLAVDGVDAGIGLPLLASERVPVHGSAPEISLVAHLLVAAPRVDARSVRLVGWGPASAPFVSPATPAASQVVDGLDGERWVVEFELDADEWSPLLLVGDIIASPGSLVPLVVRKDGVPDVLMPFQLRADGSGTWASFLTDSPMSGRWKLIAGAPGTGTPPPELSIHIRVRCA
jgi:hypothetical protein